jgi:hypothetical protein
MKNNKVVAAVFLIATISICLFSFLNFKKNNINNLPEGEILKSINSPQRDVKFNLYLCNGGATVDYALRGEIENKFGVKKNVYWNYKIKDAAIKFINPKTIKINDLEINIKNEKFDFRKT